MAGRKTIIPSFVIVLAGCFLITFIAFAGEGQQITEEGQQINEETLQVDEGDRQLDEEYAPGFYYTVKKGDTLWDLSRKFYDAEWQWPAMWGQNTDLTNPHLIYPGQRIRLYQRTDAIQQPDAADEGQAAIGEGQAASGAHVGPGGPLTETVYFMYPAIAYVGFIEKLTETPERFNKSFNDPLAMGTILKAEGEKKDMISQYDKVYINPILSKTADIPFIVGNRYSIYAPLAPVKDPATEEYAGHQYKIVGTVEVTTIFPEYVTAKITKSLDTIHAGCLIMPFEKRDKEIPVTPAPAGLTGEILIAEDHAEMSSKYSIVFLNKGEKDGVQAGQRYEIYYQDTGEIDGKEVLLSQFVFGDLLVLLTKETTATAIVTKSIRPVSRGDSFRSAL